MFKGIECLLPKALVGRPKKRLCAAFKKSKESRFVVCELPEGTFWFEARGTEGGGHEVLMVTAAVGDQAEKTARLASFESKEQATEALTQIQKAVIFSWWRVAKSVVGWMSFLLLTLAFMLSQGGSPAPKDPATLARERAQAMQKELVDRQKAMEEARRLQEATKSASGAPAPAAVQTPPAPAAPAAPAPDAGAQKKAPEAFTEEGAAALSILKK